MDLFATRLRNDRRNAGLTVRQLADQSKISFSYITKIEKGRAGSGISPQIVSALAKALGSDELEYLHLSDVIPEPLKSLLVDEKSRKLVRTLLQVGVSAKDVNRLEAILTASTTTRSTRQHETGDTSVANGNEASCGGK